MKELWVILDQNSCPPTRGDEQLMDYTQFTKVANIVGDKSKVYFSPVVFAKLQQGDRHGKISIMALFNYIMRKVHHHHSVARNK